MTLDSPLITGYLNKIKTSFSTKKVLLNKDSRIIFTCGAAKPADYTQTGRSILMKYASLHLQKFNFFMAEKLFEVLGKKDSSDLLSIEKQLTEYSDCIIVILESPSSFTELGAFSVDDELAKKMLVINDVAFKNQQSFINLGPIKKVNENSIFGNCINVDFKRFAQSFSKLEKILNDKIKSQRNTVIEINDYEDLMTKNKLRFYLIHDLVSLFFPISHLELISFLKFLFGEGNDFQIHFDIALLTSLGFIEKVNDFYIKTPYSKDLFLTSFGFNYRSIRVDLINYFKKFDSRLSLIIYKDESKAA